MSAGAQRALVALEEAADEGSTEDIIEARPPRGAAAARPSGASELAPYDNILDHKKNSKATKEANMFKHLGYYLKEKRGLDIDPKELPYEDLNSDNVGGFLNYLGKEAHAYCNPNKPLLMFESSTGYASSFKAYYANKYREKPTPPIFEADKWKHLRAKLASVIVDRNRRAGTRLSNPHEASTDSDRDTISMLSVWAATSEAAEFGFLNTDMYYCAGRSSEVSGTRKNRMIAETHSDALLRYERINQGIDRHKNYKSQNLGMYPHRVSI